MIRKSLMLGAVLSAAAFGAHAADDSMFTLDKRLVVYHVTTGPDGLSRVGTMTLENVVPTRYGGKRVLEAKADRVKMGIVEGGQPLMDFHVADHRTLLIPMQGSLIIDVGDGKQHRLVPGQIALAEDRTGKGHISGCGEPVGKRCVTLQINLDDNEVGLQNAEAPPKK